jgi:glycosyltransferase involved in cell wall biosynthesis
VPLVLVEEGFPDHGKVIERSLRVFGAHAWGRLVRKIARRVVALDAVAERQAVREGFDPDIISILPSGVDTGTFRPGLASELRHRHRIRGRVLLHIGRIEPGRGIDVLIEAFARTVGQRDDWSLVFCGNGSYRQAARAQAERLGIGANVHWTGVPRPEELPGLASLKIRRAMACGVPVLVSDVARLAGMVEHDETGLVVAAGDLDAWKAGIARLAADPNRRERWGKNARIAAEKDFSWARVADRFEVCLLAEVEAMAAEGEREREAREARLAPDVALDGQGEEHLAASEG